MALPCATRMTLLIEILMGELLVSLETLRVQILDIAPDAIELNFLVDQCSWRLDSDEKLETYSYKRPPASTQPVPVQYRLQTGT
jgi:hypothetical protein